MKKLLIATIIGINLVLAWGCGTQDESSQENKVTASSEADSTVKNISDASENKAATGKEDFETEVDKKFATDVDVKFASNWIKAVDVVESKFLDNEIVSEGVPVEIMKQKAQSLRDDLRSGVVNDEITSFYRLYEVLGCANMLHSELYYTDYEKKPSIGYWRIDGLWCDDGFYLYELPVGNEEYLGKKLVKIGGKTLDEVLDLVAGVYGAETDSVRKLNIFSTNPTLLYYLGIINKNDTSVTLTVEVDKQEISFAIPINNDYNGEVSYLEFIETPKILQIRSENYANNINYYYEVLKDYNAVYFEYMACSDSESISVSDFFDKIMEEYEKDNTLNTLIIDVRFNGGGFRHLLRNKFEQYQDKLKDKKVCVLINGLTASAGVQVYEDCLEFGFDTTSYGTPTAGAIHNYTEKRYEEIPEVGLTVSYPTVFDYLPELSKRQGDVIESVKPDVQLDNSIEDYINGRDVVYEKVLEDIK